jgi:hypothetical protein
MSRLKAAAAIFVYLALQGFVYGVDIILRHGLDRSWPAHARYHVVVSGIHIVSLAAITLVHAVGGLRKRRRTSWLTLAVVSTVAWAAWPIARLVAGEPPPAWVQLVTAGSLLLALFGLWLAYGPCFDEALKERAGASS